MIINSWTVNAIALDAFFIEPFLYGILVFLFTVSIHVLLKHGSKRTSRINIWTSIVMFVLSTIHVLASLVRAIEAFVKHSDTPLGVQEFVEDQMTFWDLLTTIIYGLQTLLGDGIMLYRVYVAWKGNGKLFFGLLLCFLTNVGVGIAALTVEHQALEPTQTAPVINATLTGLVLSFFSLTFLTNLSCAILIASRIWGIKHQAASASNLPSFTDKSLFSVTMIVIQSGAIYPIFLLTLITLTITQSRSLHIVFETMTLIIAITFTLLNTSVGLTNSEKISDPLPLLVSQYSVSSPMVFAPPSPQQSISHIHGPGIQTLHAGSSISLFEIS